MADDQRTGQADTAPQAHIDVLDTYCYRWMTPFIWPHAVRDIGAIQTTRDRSRVTCTACLAALDHVEVS